MRGPLRPAGARRVAEALALAGLLGAAALLLGRHLGIPSAEFDEGVYLASARALAGGAALGDEVFASQPPVFFRLAEGTSRLVGGDPTLMRGAALLWGLCVAAAAFLLVRPRGGRGAGLLAAALVALAPGLTDRAAVVSADVPAMALALGALVAGHAAVRRPAWAAAAGALAAAAVLTKLSAVAVVPALAVLVAVRRPGRRAAVLMAAGAGATALMVVGAHANDLPALWSAAVGMRGAARGVALPPGEVPVALVLGFAGLGVVLLAGLLARPRAGLAPWARAAAPELALLGAGAVVVVAHRPLFLHHLIVLSAPLAVTAALALPVPGPRAALAAAAAGVALLVPGAVAGRELMGPADLARIEAVAAAVRDRTTPVEAVVSDLPLVPPTARRAAVTATIDASFVRAGAGALGADAIVAAAAGAGAVVAGRAFRGVAGLDARLRARFPGVTEVGGVRVYTRGRPARSTR